MREYFVWLAKLVTILLLLFFVVPFLLGMAAVIAGGLMGDKVSSSAKTVAVVELEGEIFDSKEVLNDLYGQRDSQKVKGTVLRINSPGGAVGPSQEIFRAVKNLNSINPKKPVVVSMGAVAASGGLYSALGGAKIFAEPGTLTGSIGVIMQLPNVRKLADFAGINFVTIKSGEMKDIGNLFREMTDAERIFLEATLSKVHGEFKSAVSEGRNIPMEEVEKFADGRLIIGSEAKDLRLIDEFGGVYEAAAAALELAGEPLKPGEIPDLYYPSDRFKQFRRAFKGMSGVAEMFRNEVQFKYLMY